jgi:membrane-associated phospholipid phosphatase
MPSSTLTNRPLAWIFPAACALTALGLFASGLNQSVFVALHQSFLEAPGALWQSLTVLGESSVLPLVLLLLFRNRPDLLWAVTLGGIAAYAISHGLKPVVNELRPPAVISDLVVIGPRLLHSSFPSGHSTTGFSVMALLILGAPLRGFWLVAAALLVAVLIAASRIAVGVHWPVDVLSGAVIGWISAWLGLWLARKMPWGAGKGRALPLLLMALMIVFNLMSPGTGYPEGLWVQKLVSILAIPALFYQIWQWRVTKPN